jgi:hypothetical protein
VPRDRGEYRSIYVILFDGPEFQALDADARWLLVTMRLTLGACAIAAIPAMMAVLTDRTGLPPDRVRQGLEALRSAGWIEVESNIAWVVRGLEFEPHLEAKNQPHRTYVQRHVASLPRLPIVDRFRAKYAEWFDGALPCAPSSEGAAPAAPSREEAAPAASPNGSRGPPEGPSRAPRGPLEAYNQSQRERPTQTAGLVGDARAREGLAYHVRCVIALNRALRDHPGIGAAMREVSSSEMQGVVTWEADGIPIELAEATIARVMARYRPSSRSRQPSSLLYFDQAIRRAWETTRGQPTVKELPSAKLPVL